MASNMGGLGMLAVGVIALLALFWFVRSYMAPSAGANGANAPKNGPANAMGAMAAANAGNNGNNGNMVNSLVGPDPSEAESEANTADNAGIDTTVEGDIHPAPQGTPGFALVDDSAYFMDYPSAQDPSSLNSDGTPSAYDMSLAALMPASWRGNASCSGENAQSGDNWDQYAPTKQAFDNYITAAGSARLGLNTRTRNPTGGVNYLLRPAPPVPVTGASIPFGDSGFRQDLVMNSLGWYPENVQC